MSLTNTASPVLLCSFENSNVDSISSISPSYSNNTAISYTTGKSGQSVFLNGPLGIITNDGPYLTYPISLSSYPGFTVCLWIYPTSLISGASNTQVFMSLTNGINTNGSYMQWGCDLGDPTKFHVYGQLPVAPTQVVYNGAYRTITVGAWTHLAISYSGTSFTAYINGAAYTTLGSSVRHPVAQTGSRRVSNLSEDDCRWCWSEIRIWVGSGPCPARTRDAKTSQVKLAPVRNDARKIRSKIYGVFDGKNHGLCVQD